MNNATLDTNNNPKTRMELILEFCALPIPRIAEIPFYLFGIINKWVENAFNWLSETVPNRMSDIKEMYPKVYWGSSIIWIPLLIILLFYEGSFIAAIGVFTIIGIIALAISFTVVCKITYLICVITGRYADKPHQKDK